MKSKLRVKLPGSLVSVTIGNRLFQRASSHSVGVDDAIQDLRAKLTPDYRVKKWPEYQATVQPYVTRNLIARTWV